MIFKSQKTDIGSPNHVLDQRGLEASLELPETSMVKNLLKKSSNGCENGTNGSKTSKNPWLGFYGTSIGQTMKKLGLLHFPPSSFAGTGSTKRTSVCIPGTRSQCML
jgi:hypothetical protein